jgi:pilus assembly protein CpaF
MVLMAGFEMPISVVRNYIATAVKLIVQLSRLKGGARKVMRVSEIVGLKKRRIYVVRDVFGFRQTGVKDGRAIGEFYATGYAPKLLERLHAAGADLPKEMFVERSFPGE